MKRTFAAGVCLSLALSGCASTSSQSWTPQIDTQGINQTRYAQDFADCKKFAEANPDADAAKKAKSGAIGMGILGGVALVGMTVATGGLALLPAIAIAGAPAIGTGMAMGAAGGAVEADAKYKGVIQSCLAGRGYKVIG